LQENTVNTLVVYFSRSGHTQQMAREIAQKCGADLEEIREQDAREGVWGYMRSGWQVLSRAEPPVQPTAKDPAAYDTVVIGTPIWISHPAPPVRTWVRHNAPRFKNVAFFCTEGGSGDSNAFAELSELCGKAPVATLTVTEKQLPTDKHTSQLNQFATELAA
jgi:flavodoxin